MAGALALAPACRRTPDREAALRALVLEVVRPNAQALLAESRTFDAALQKSLDAGRDAFKRALLAWKRAATFRDGPLVQSNALVRAMFWPARPKAIDAAVLGVGSIDRRSIEAASVDAKGLFALEYLLFAGTEGGERRHRYACEASANVVAYAERIARLLGDGRDYADAFARAGRDSVNQLIVQSIDTIEALAGRLAKLTRTASAGEIRPVAVESYYSGTSLAIALALVTGTEALYSGAGGGGLGDVAAGVSKPVDTRVRDAFTAARDALEKLGAPLEQSVRSNPSSMANASAAIKALELALKVDLASALGITLTFTSADGD